MNVSADFDDRLRLVLHVLILAPKIHSKATVEVAFCWCTFAAPLSAEAESYRRIKTGYRLGTAGLSKSLLGAPLGAYVFSVLRRFAIRAALLLTDLANAAFFYRLNAASCSNACLHTKPSTFQFEKVRRVQAHQRHQPWNIETHLGSYNPVSWHPGLITLHKSMALGRS